MRNPIVLAPRRRSIERAVIGVWLALFAEQAIAEPLRLSNGPSAQWELVEKDGEHHCMLRTRVVGAAPLDTVDVDRSLGGKKIELTLHGPPTGELPSEIGAGYAIGTGKNKNQRVGEYDTDDGRRKVTLEFKGDEAAAISKGARVSFAIRRGQVIVIDTKSLVALLPTADTCSRNYYVQLGADPAMVAQIAADPYAEDSALFKTADYPAAAYRNLEQGTTIALAIVDEDGKVADCRIARSSNSRALDHATCDILKRRKFEPATNLSGKPVKGPTVLTVNWVLPVARRSRP